MMKDIKKVLEILEKYKEEANVHGELVFGTYEEAKKWIGKKTEIRYLEDPIDHLRVKLFCELVEDGNPSYWDEEFAKKQWGGLRCPPAMLGSLALPIIPLWRPEYIKVSKEGWLPTRIPLPGITMINVEVEGIYYRPIRVGERLGVQEEVISISPEKKTSLGVGHFIVTLTTYYDENGKIVAQEKNVLFRFTPSEERI
jgi:acyl dehydratase